MYSTLSHTFWIVFLVLLFVVPIPLVIISVFGESIINSRKTDHAKNDTPSEKKKESLFPRVVFGCYIVLLASSLVTSILCGRASKNERQQEATESVPFVSENEAFVEKYTEQYTEHKRVETNNNDNDDAYIWYDVDGDGEDEYVEVFSINDYSLDEIFASGNRAVF